MKVFRQVSKVLGLIFGVVFAVGLMAGPVRAEGSPDYFLQMSPTRLDFDLKPNSKSTTKFKVLNAGEKEFTYELEVLPYSVSNDDYAADFSTSTKYTDLKDWIKLSKEKGTLQSMSSEEITVTVEVPKDVPAGGQYAAIVARLVTNNEGGHGTGVALTQQVGILTYAEVAGNTRFGGKVVENNVAGFLFEPPISATSLIENTGNVHVDATYILQVFPLFGNEELYTNEENPEKRTILPETRRYNTITWNGSPHLGIFRVRQTVKILGETSTEEKVVFLCPLWFLFIIIILVFCVVFWIVSRVRSKHKDLEEE